MSLSILNNINVDKVDVGYASRIQSYRIQDPSAMTCPLWAGQDLAGRPVCASSFLSKMEGCHSAEDRLFVENSLRPQWTNYVTLSAAGVKGEGLYDTKSTTMGAASLNRQAAVKAMTTGKPHFGMSNIDRIRANAQGIADVDAANAYSQATQDKDAGFSTRSRLNQSKVIGAQTMHKMDRTKGELLPNAHGDYMGRRGNSQGYMRVNQYP